MYENQGIAKGKIQPQQLELLRHILRDQLIPRYKLHEFFTCEVDQVLIELHQFKLDDPSPLFTIANTRSTLSDLKIVQDAQHRRLRSTVDLRLGKFLLTKNSEHDLRNRLHELNAEARGLIEGYLTEAVNNSISTVQYFFFAEDGPKWERVTKLQPIVRTYFYFPFEDKSVDEDEALSLKPELSCRVAACNGWVMGDDPLRNFASRESTVYLRRQLIPWGDLVKLRFGEKPEDSPEVWAYMAEYTRITARIFHGVRLDNCHSTPIHVAQHLLDVARQVRPDLYVIAELFTNSEQIDNKFVKKLGITSLIRESMNAWNANELGRLVHRFSGEPVGSFVQRDVRPLLESIPHAIFYDQTHDNQPLLRTRSIYDVLASSGLVYMTKAAVGSLRGFDELVPHYIDVVKEDRPYKKWSTNEQAKLDETSINANSGEQSKNDCYFKILNIVELP